VIAEDQLPLFIFLFLVCYTWAVYPGVLWILATIFARPPIRGRHEPTVSIIVAAHNEEACIAAKLDNCLRLQYPRDSMEIIVASDNSTDRTDQIVRELAAFDPRIRLVKSEGRAGKSGVQNLAAEQARGELLFLTDANTRVPAEGLRLLASNFADPRVGLVSATIHFITGSDAVSKGQGLYWRYEYFLRQAESDIGILATGSGAALAIRRELYSSIPPRYGDDCILPLDVRLKGYLVLNDPQAVVFDSSPHSVAGELRSRIRMTARNWTGTLSRPALLNPFRFPLSALGLTSHKLLRWLTPFFLLAIFILNTALVFRHEAIALWSGQVLFYCCAFVGWRRICQQRPAGLFGHAFSFCLANVGFLLGMVKAVRNQAIVTY
jgi:cellulose synthase/poly-beta-1,6-N-acetylglucosamine synthase-like glycosyltransferase